MVHQCKCLLDLKVVSTFFFLTNLYKPSYSWSRSYWILNIQEAQVKPLLKKADLTTVIYALVMADRELNSVLGQHTGCWASATRHFAASGKKHMVLADRSAPPGTGLCTGWMLRKCTIQWVSLLVHVKHFGWGRADQRWIRPGRRGARMVTEVVTIHRGWSQRF